MLADVIAEHIGKVVFLSILAFGGAVTDVQILKGTVGEVKNKTDAYEANAKTQKKLLCKIALKMEALDDNEKVKTCSD